MKGYRRSNQSKNLRAAIVLALGLGITNLAVAAVGLGPIQVNSYMGQPLRAAIRVSGISPSQASATTVTLASPDEYRRRGVVRTAEQANLSFRLQKSGAGYVIVVSSRSQIREPFVNFVLTLHSGGESFSREYSAFLDPDPAVAAGIAAPVTVAPPKKAKLAPPPVIPLPKNQAKTVIAKPVTAKTIAPASTETPGWGGVGAVAPDARPIPLTDIVDSAQPSAKESNREPSSTHNRTSSSRHRENRYGPVQRGETLFSIANAVRPSNISVATMQRAIYNTNRRAFASNDMDSLMAGTTLLIPKDIPAAVAIRVEKPKTVVKKAEKLTPNRVDETNEKTEKGTTTSAVEQQVENLPPKSESKIAPVLEKSAENDVKPAEMTPEQAAQEAEKRAESHSNTAPNAEQGMKLDGADSIDNTPAPDITAENNATIAEQNSTDITAPTEVPSSDNNNIAPTPTSQEPAPEATPVQPTPVAVNEPTQSAPKIERQPAESSLPFGLKIWQLALGGGALLLLLLLLLFKNRKSTKVELSQEELDELAHTMGNSEVEIPALAPEHASVKPASQVGTFDDSHLNAHSSSALANGDYDNEFFRDGAVHSTHEESLSHSTTSTSLPENDLMDLDDFFSDAEQSTSSSHSFTSEQNASASEPESFSELDDFFAEAENNSHHAVSTSSVDDVEDFFKEDSAKDDAVHFSAISPSKTNLEDDFFKEDIFDANTTTTSSSSNIDEEDFFKTESFDEPPALEATQANFEEDFFKEEDNVAVNQAQSHNTLDDGLDFFSETSNTQGVVDEFVAETSRVNQESKPSEVPQPDFVPGLDDIDFFAESEEEIAGTVTPSAHIDNSSISAHQANTHAEPADIQAMDINIDLAMAYIKNGVKPEKARKWLEEVLEKGTQEQRSIATDLLKKLS